MVHVENSKIHLDDILIKFDICGRYHLQAFLLLALVNLFVSVSDSNFIFVAEKVEYRCKDERFANDTCTLSSNSTEVCSEWIYDKPDSFVAEFQLACEEWKRTLVGTAHAFGYMVGLLFMGPLSDKIGRKKTLVLSCAIGGLIGITKSFQKWYWGYIVCEFLEAAFGDACSAAFIMTVEIVAHEKLLVYQMLCFYGYSMGHFVLPLAAYLVPYWRNLVRVLYAPALLFIFYSFCLDESARWLLSNGEKDKAVSILKEIAVKNKIVIDGETESLTHDENSGITFAELLKSTFKSSTLLKRFFICVSWWTTSTFVNYGMQINTVALAGNKYVNYALLCIVDVIGNTGVTYLLIKFRRKIPLICTFFLSAIFCLCQPFIPSHLLWISILLYMIGKLMSMSYFNITYIYTSEMFPTYTRNSMHALCSSLGRIGSILAPQTPLLLVYWEGLPALVFGGASLLAGIATLFAPDIDDDVLPDNVQQAEEIGSKKTNKTKSKGPELNVKDRTAMF